MLFNIEDKGEFPVKEWLTPQPILHTLKESRPVIK